MCFLTKAFAAGLSGHCGQGSGPHLFYLYRYTTLIKGRKKAGRENVWYGSQNRAWLQIKCGRTTPVVIMISASESWINVSIIKPATLHLLDVFLVSFNSPWSSFLSLCNECSPSWSPYMAFRAEVIDACSWKVKNRHWSLTLSRRWSIGHVSRNLWKGLP